MSSNQGWKGPQPPPPQTPPLPETAHPSQFSYQYPPIGMNQPMAPFNPSLAPTPGQTTMPPPQWPMHPYYQAIYAQGGYMVPNYNMQTNVPYQHNASTPANADAVSKQAPPQPTTSSSSDKSKSRSSSYVRSSQSSRDRYESKDRKRSSDRRRDSPDRHRSRRDSRHSSSSSSRHHNDRRDSRRDERSDRYDSKQSKRSDRYDSGRSKGSDQRDEQRYDRDRGYSRSDEPSRWQNDLKLYAKDEFELNEIDEEVDESKIWTRMSPADLYYEKSPDQPGVLVATQKLQTLLDRFDDELVQRGPRVRNSKPKYEKPAHPTSSCKKSCKDSSDSDSDSDDSSDSDHDALAEMETKKKHPDRLHEELWYNDPGEMNDGPLCRCSIKAKRFGIRHSIYPGEGNLKACDPLSNNAGQLYHYRITMSPHTNFVTKNPTMIKHDGHEFIFEGFSLFSHSKLEPNLPLCKVIRFNINYTIMHVEERFPENFSVKGLELFTQYLFKEVLELVDLQFKAHDDDSGCPIYHLMPRFARALEDNGKEILSMSQVLAHFLNINKYLVDEKQLNDLLDLSNYDWLHFTDQIKGMIVTHPGKKPCSIRVDQLDREVEDSSMSIFPEIVHFGIKPPLLTYAGNPSYQKAWREYVKFRHLLANKPKVMSADKCKLQQKESILQDLRLKGNLKRDVTVAVSSQGFYRTGIMCDIVQHALLIPVLICHLRFHKSLTTLEEKIGYKFQDRYLLQLALTHPSYRENFGTNPDHARNSLTNCGMRQPEYGDRRVHFMNTRKRGISTLINIMSRFGHKEETSSCINHNERLEFLGDAVVEFISSIHLFHMFPDLEEGGLATYRAAIVQNQHLAVLAKHLELEKHMLFAHGSDLCHDFELKHAMANCFEAIMGALFLDGGIEIADRIFANTLFLDEVLKSVWVNYPRHVLQEQEPGGDRKWIDSVPLLQKLTKFEEAIGVEFTHIRLLARSFTMRSLGFNHLTLGSNQRLEFLGDTVLQLIASEYLYKFFPQHHEGHLSLLRSSLVNNRTQSVVCEDLGMQEYAINSSSKTEVSELKTKDKADLLEAFLGALYVDKDLNYCKVFCQVCFFPRLQDFIMNQDWNDPKSKLQQCCLTLRSMNGGEPDIPIYKVVETKGPTNTRIYIVAVYFRDKRLAKGSGHSIQLAEMDAANNALACSKELFPQLVHQKRVIERSMNRKEN